MTYIGCWMMDLALMLRTLCMITTFRAPSPANHTRHHSSKIIPIYPKRWEYRPSTSPNGIGMWHAETHFTLADLYHLQNYSIATGRTQCATLGCWTSGLLYNKSTLQAHRHNTSCATFPMDMPLVPTLPLHPKIQFFVWHMLHGGINTCARLHKFLSEISPECLCHCQSEETLDDLFAHSSFAKLVWQHFPHYLPNPTQYHTARYRFWNTNPSVVLLD